MATTGGSTNAVLHLMAIAFEAGVELELEDFNRVAAKVPHLADTKPHGKYHMVDIDRIGGVPVVMQMLHDEGLLHADEITVTGQTVAENLAMLEVPAPDGEVIHAFEFHRCGFLEDGGVRAGEHADLRVMIHQVLAQLGDVPITMLLLQFGIFSACLVQYFHYVTHR